MYARPAQQNAFLQTPSCRELQVEVQHVSDTVTHVDVGHRLHRAESAARMVSAA
jgi:hypothetical protein